MEFTERKADFYFDTDAVEVSLIETEVTNHYWVIWRQWIFHHKMCQPDAWKGNKGLEKQKMKCMK